MMAIPMCTVRMDTVPKDLRLCRDEHDTDEGPSEPCEQNEVRIDDVLPVKNRVNATMPNVRGFRAKGKNATYRQRPIGCYP